MTSPQSTLRPRIHPQCLRPAALSTPRTLTVARLIGASSPATSPHHAALGLKCFRYERPSTPAPTQSTTTEQRRKKFPRIPLRRSIRAKKSAANPPPRSAKRHTTWTAREWFAMPLHADSQRLPTAILRSQRRRAPNWAIEKRDGGPTGRWCFMDEAQLDNTASWMGPSPSGGRGLANFSSFRNHHRWQNKPESNED